MQHNFIRGRNTALTAPTQSQPRLLAENHPETHRARRVYNTVTMDGGEDMQRSTSGIVILDSHRLRKSFLAELWSHAG